MLLNCGFLFSKLKIFQKFPINLQLAKLSSSYKEHKITIKNFEMNYIKVGQGPHYVLCAPGSLGSLTDFEPQIEGFDRNKFSLIVMDSPGYGKSIKLGDDTTKDLFKTYSDATHHFMESLKIKNYSYLGWSMGGKAGIILAALHPDVINKFVIWGASTFFYQHEVDNYEKMGNINNWSQSAVNKLKKMYGEENYTQRVKLWANAMVEYHYSNQGIADIVAKDVKCPTLILHGAKDPVVNPLHATYMQKKITNSRLHVYPEGKHNIHIKYAADFNKRVQDFLSET